MVVGQPSDLAAKPPSERGGEKLREKYRGLFADFDVGVFADWGLFSIENRRMKKDFDQWNEKKKSVNEQPDNFGVHEREIWWASLGINIGVEIDGKSEDFERPVLILRKFNRQMAWALPTTSQGKDERFYEKFSYGGKEYFVVLTQIRTISTKRLLRKIGMMAIGDFEKIQQKLIDFIHNNENPLGSGSSRRPKP